MSETKPKFTLIDDPKPSPAAIAGTQMLLLGLKALSQRALAGISDLFSLILVGAVCLLAWHVLDNPNREQIITVFGFAVFCVVVDIVRRRK